jgi:E3 ubiquitin-protein ligase RAD18
MDTQDDLRESVECPICFHRMDQAAFIGCGHKFCLACIQTALSRQPKCPLCRATAPPDTIRPDHTLRDVISRLGAGGGARGGGSNT